MFDELLAAPEPEMTPLYLFLGSSLNVELVYIILTSISVFGKVSKDAEGHCQLAPSDDLTARVEEQFDGSCQL